MRESEFEYLLKIYFSGKIKGKLNYLKEKYEKQFDDDYYCTLGSPILDRVGKNLTNKISDPTGGKATRLADIKLLQQRNYEYYLKFYQIMTEYIKKLDRFLVDNMKIYLGLIDSPLFKDEEKEILQHFEKIKYIFFKERILEKEKKVDPYQEFFEKEKQEPAADENNRLSLEEAQQRVLMYR
ncbi:MAG: hypothetical protein UMU04_08000 [Halanaerobiales bacterium]|nr:hypothetical protein [Halanaerobiales bacterium]